MTTDRDLLKKLTEAAIALNRANNALSALTHPPGMSGWAQPISPTRFRTEYIATMDAREEYNKALRAAVEFLEVDLQEEIKEKDHVKITCKTTFAQGQTGVVLFITPSGEYWIRRDKANDDDKMCFKRNEIELVNSRLCPSGQA